MFEKHKFEFHGETYCGCCERNYEDFEKYFQHLKHVCVICQKKFKSNDSFACHLRNFHSNKPRKKLRSEEGSEEENFSCGLCQERHSSREELVAHVNSRHPARVSVNTGGIVKDEGKAGGSGESVYTCSLCSKVFYQPKLFERHKWEEHDRKVCGCCGKFYEEFEEFYQHLLHICEFCGKQFKTNDSLGCHIRNYHADQYRPKQPKPKAGQETGTSTSKQNAKKNS